jgi:hypothetical protein
MSFRQDVTYALWMALLAGLASAQPESVVRCRVVDDPRSRVYELQRVVDGSDERWVLAMRSRAAGASPVLLPLPDARPKVTETSVALDYQTLNGGRNVAITVTPSGASIDIDVNFELEVNVERDLDPRVELMNTEGPISTLSCTVRPRL